MSAVDEAMDCATQELNSRQALTDLEKGGGGSSLKNLQVL